jgi:thymidylate synthase
MHRQCFLNAQEAFEYIYSQIIRYGYNTQVGTRALYDVGFYIEHPSDNNIKTRWRKWNPRYAEREWQWYLSQNRSVEELKKHAPIWDKMHGGDNIVNSNYGWQWGRNNQLDKTIEQLKKDKNTRQAWISIFDGKEKDQYQYDTPCTLAVGFNVHPCADNELNMTVLMRSNDLVYGFCNEQYCFSKLQELVAAELGLKVGTYYHFAHDMHIYEKHFNLK